MSSYGIMTGSELIKKVEKLAKKSKLKAHVDKNRGKGSHITLHYGENYTTVPNIQNELKTGLFNAILKQLGIKKDEIT